MGLKQLFAISICLICISCEDIPLIEDQRTGSIIVQAHLVAGDTIDNVFVYTFDSAGNFIADTDASVVVSNALNEVRLEHIGNGRYEDVVGEFEIISGSEYEVRIGNGFKTAFKSIKIPSSFDWEEDPVDFIEVDPEIPGENVQNISWMDIPDLEYILTLELLESDPVTIGFDNGGLFNAQFEAPVPFSSTFLRADDFEFLGSHLLSVYAVEAEYVDLYFESITEQRQSLPLQDGGIEGGYGFVIGLSKISDEFIISVP